MTDDAAPLHYVVCNEPHASTDTPKTCKMCKSVSPCANCRLHEDYCLTCYDIVLLQRNPRPNFMRDQKVCIEYMIRPDYNAKKRKAGPIYPSAQRPPPPAKIHMPNNNEDWNALRHLTLYELAERKYPDYKPTRLAEMHPHPLDKSVYLDESEYTDEHGNKNHRHQYYVQYEPNEQMESENNVSTSALVHNYFGEFVEIDALAAMLRGGKWGPGPKRKYGKYYTRNKDQLAQNLLHIAHDWEQNNKEALSVGRFVHFLIECDLNGCLDLATHPLYSQYANIRQYNAWKAEFFTPFFVPYRTEFRWRTCKKYRHVGTADLIAVRKDHPPPDQTNGTLFVVDIDWKNLEELKKRGFFGKKGIDLCDHIDDCNFMHYTLQQSDYARFPQQPMYDGNWKFNGYTYQRMVFTDMSLVCFHKNNPDDKAQVETLEHMAKEISQMWEKRAVDVAAWYELGRPKLPSKHKARPTDDERRVLIADMLPRLQADLLASEGRTIYDEELNLDVLLS